MLEISRFFGIIIRMFPEIGAPHHRPHFHAVYQEFKAVFALDPIECIGGSLRLRSNVLRSLSEQRGLRSKIGRHETGPLGDTRQHVWPNLFVVMERENEVRPIVALECSMRAGLAFDLPADSKQRGQYAVGFGGWPVAHAA